MEKPRCGLSRNDIIIHGPGNRNSGLQPWKERVGRIWEPCRPFSAPSMRTIPSTMASRGFASFPVIQTDGVMFSQLDGRSMWRGVRHGPVKGEGGNVELEMTQSHIDSYGPSYLDGATGETYLDGDVYPCAPSVQEGKCRNSLTPLAGVSDGEGGLKSMPKAFYWDAYLGLGVSIIGLLVSLTMHYVIVPGWRTRVKTMKQLEQDHEDVSSDLAEEEHDDDEADEEYDDEEYDEDAIDVGDEAGVVIDGEEYYGTIISFDDEEGTVTIEDDESGEQVTGDQDSMFLE